MGKIRSGPYILMGKPVRQIPFEACRNRHKCDVKVDMKEMMCECGLDKIHWWAVMFIMIKLQVP
jgi:hypothetical protein